MLFKKKKQIKEPITELAIERDEPKVIREAKLKPNTCKICGTVFQGEVRHLFSDAPIFASCSPKISIMCPICRATNKAEFEVAENE